MTGRGPRATIAAPDFDLAATLDSGQVFHWVREGDDFVGTIGRQPVSIRQRGSELIVNREAAAAARRYFALDHPLTEIYASLPTDPAMSAALEFCRGLRIIRQSAWECVATFITSSMKQVAHIAQISHTLRQKFGERVQLEGRELFAYPTPEKLAELDEADLRACALGYRAKNLLGAARLIAAGEVDLAAIAQMNDAAAHAALCRLPGVGPKVANCALLFGYERLRAFPIDVWIERVLLTLYFPRKRKVTAKRLREFAASYFGPYGGYAQQYLFHHARKAGRREALPPAIDRPKTQP
jgi:N-glycosylase/DNA lyase